MDDADYAASALLEQLVLKTQRPVDPEVLLSAERAVVQASFDGDRKRYWAALAQAKLFGTGFATELPSGVVAFLKTDTSLPAPDVQLLFHLHSGRHPELACADLPVMSMMK